MCYECLNESLSLIMNQRLQTFLTKNNTIIKAQITFMPRSRTTDHIFTLNTLCNKYIKDKNLASCLLTLLISKNHNSIWHKGLFNTLSTDQVHGKFLNKIQNIYKNSSSGIKLGNRCTQFFFCLKGVQQGCPLSPNLLNIYVNDLFERLSGVNTHPPCLNNEQITALMYADDLIILSLSHEGLQK